MLIKVLFTVPPLWEKRAAWWLYVPTVLPGTTCPPAAHQISQLNSQNPSCQAATKPILQFQAKAAASWNFSAVSIKVHEWCCFDIRLITFTFEIYIKGCVQSFHYPSAPPHSLVPWPLLSCSPNREIIQYGTQMSDLLFRLNNHIDASTAYYLFCSQN